MCIWCEFYQNKVIGMGVRDKSFQKNGTFLDNGLYTKSYRTSMPVFVIYLSTLLKHFLVKFKIYFLRSLAKYFSKSYLVHTTIFI